MPTTDERREIAARLRKIDVRFTHEEELAAIYAAFGLNIEEYWLHQLLADLIKPEERTCRNEFDMCFAFECSECGVNVEGGDMLGHNSSEGAFNFCPNCGAKVVRE